MASLRGVMSKSGSICGTRKEIWLIEGVLFGGRYHYGNCLLLSVCWASCSRLFTYYFLMMGIIIFILQMGKSRPRDVK